MEEEKVEVKVQEEEVEDGRDNEESKVRTEEVCTVYSFFENSPSGHWLWSERAQSSFGGSPGARFRALQTALSLSEPDKRAWIFFPKRTWMKILMGSHWWLTVTAIRPDIVKAESQRRAE